MKLVDVKIVIETSSKAIIPETVGQIKLTYERDGGPGRLEFE